MALKKCSNCSGDMSTIATKCPHCGIAVHASSTQTASVEKKFQTSMKVQSFEKDTTLAPLKSRFRGITLGVFLVVSVILVVIGYYIFRGAVEQIESSKALAASAKRLAAAEKKVRDVEDSIILKGQNAIRDHLKDPESARFKNTFVFVKRNNLVLYFSENLRDSLAVCGEVNAKNSMGGYVGYKRFFSNGKDAGRIETEDDYEFQSHWENLCEK